MLPVTTRRVQQILQQRPTMKYTKRLKEPQLARIHKKNRLKFARDHMCWGEEWKNVIFSLEKKFNLN